MRTIRFKEGVREAKGALRNAGSLIRENLVATLLLGLALSFLPGLASTALMLSEQGSMIDLWEEWIAAAFAGRAPAEDLLTMVYSTLQNSGATSLGTSLMELITSLLFTPLLMSSLALLFNGFVRESQRTPALAAAEMSVRSAKSLVLVALACMVAEWFVQMVPSIASGLLFAVAGLISFIPVLGSIASVLAVVLSLLVSLLTDFAVTVIFCYVWIAVSCEGASGFSALVRSWQLTRDAMHRTIYSLLAWIVLRLAAVLAFIALWLLVGRSLSISALAYCLCAVGAVFQVLLGGITTALYLGKPAGGQGPYGGRRQGGERMKRANID